MDDSFGGFIQDMFYSLRNIPLFNEHYDKLFAILAVVLVVYFVGTIARTLLAGALGIFLLWGFRYQTISDTHHVNRYTGAVCDASSECWQPERGRDPYDRYR